MKTENEDKIKCIKDELIELSAYKTNIAELIEDMVKQAMKIVPMYPKKPVEFQRLFISSIYPRKLTHFEGIYRTPKTNSGAEPISLINE